MEGTVLSNKISATYSCWSSGNYVLGPSVPAWVPHKKGDLESHPVSVGRPGKIVTCLARRLTFDNEGLLKCGYHPLWCKWSYVSPHFIWYNMPSRGDSNPDTASCSLHWIGQGGLDKITIFVLGSYTHAPCVKTTLCHIQPRWGGRVNIFTLLASVKLHLIFILTKYKSFFSFPTFRLN